MYADMQRTVRYLCVRVRVLCVCPLFFLVEIYARLRTGGGQLRVHTEVEGLVGGEIKQQKALVAALDKQFHERAVRNPAEVSNNLGVCGERGCHSQFWATHDLLRRARWPSNCTLNGCKAALAVPRPAHCFTLSSTP